MSWFSKKQPSAAPDVSEPAGAQPTVEASASPVFTDEVTDLVNSALTTIQSQISFMGGAFTVVGTGSDGLVMTAVTYLEKAHHAQPESAELHYAYCSALAMAMQYKTARDEMDALHAAHPEFALARWALAGWDDWRSPLTLMEWTPATAEVPSALSDMVIGCTLRPVRDGIAPRAAYFLRDRGGDFQDPAALRSARIDITTVVDEASSSVPVVGVYARVWDDPANSFNMEAHELPLASHGAQSRMACQYLATQRDIDFVVLSADDRILLNRRIEMPERMRAANDELVRLLDRPEGTAYEQEQVIAAIRAHQQNFAATTVLY